jgi:hypothetical protein
MGKEEEKSEEINKVCGPVWVKIIVYTKRNIIMGNQLARRMVNKACSWDKAPKWENTKHFNVCTSVDMLLRKHPVINSIVHNLPIDYWWFDDWVENLPTGYWIFEI